MIPTPTRAAALTALEAFAPYAGRDYASRRNFDLAEGERPAVSLLSPYIRHGLISQQEVLREVLRHHDARDASKYIQEVLWRSYWKGWLEMRPQAWRDYQTEVATGINRLQTESGLRREFEAACKGETEISCFNYWSQNIVKYGYIHNHARMWFASIWIFTLRLPWALGADFFLRHLLDGDTASNTLSWRWVGGMQTKGKTYLATPDNIATFTQDRFQPKDGTLAPHAEALESQEHPLPEPLPEDGPFDTDSPTGLLFHDDDVMADHIPTELGNQVATCAISCAAQRSPLAVAPNVTAFAQSSTLQGPKSNALPNTQADTVEDVVQWAASAGLRQIVTPYTPVGPVADQFDTLETALSANNVALVRRMRPFDRMCWPHAQKGFFKFKEHIPNFLSKI